ncbi:MAG TPA: tetratricopeptide repeat protein [Candidatus Acidoferrum sp.]|nr:tetratricopeptide repeat protein [Candidatus Acidoferrum sp.]
MRIFHALLGWLHRNEEKLALPTTAGSLVNQACAALARGDFLAARRFLLKVVEHRDEIQDVGSLTWIFSSLAWTWFESEQYRDCADFFSQYIADHPSDALSYFCRGGAFWYSGDVTAAIEDYSKALEIIPNDSRTLSARGQVFVERGEWQKAVQDLDAALNHIGQARVPNERWRTALRAFALNGRAAAYAGLGEFDRALTEFENSILLCPQNAWVYYNRAEAYERRGRTAEALENYKLALTMKSPSLNALRRQKAELKVKTLR